MLNVTLPRDLPRGDYIELQGHLSQAALLAHGASEHMSKATALSRARLIERARGSSANLARRISKLVADLDTLEAKAPPEPCTCCVPSTIAKHKRWAATTQNRIDVLWTWLRDPKHDKRSHTADAVRAGITHLSRVLQHELNAVTALEAVRLDFEMPNNDGYDVDLIDYPEDEMPVWVDTDD